MTKTESLTTVKNFGETRSSDEGGVHANKHYYRRVRFDAWIFQNRPGFALPSGNAARTLNNAIVTLRLLLFYIVNNGGKSRTVRAQPRPQQSLSRKKAKPL